MLLAEFAFCRGFIVFLEETFLPEDLLSESLLGEASSDYWILAATYKINEPGNIYLG
jgi:hypothetical protein